MIVSTFTSAIPDQDLLGNDEEPSVRLVDFDLLRVFAALCETFFCFCYFYLSSLELKSRLCKRDGFLSIISAVNHSLPTISRILLLRSRNVSICSRLNP